MIFILGRKRWDVRIPVLHPIFFLQCDWWKVINVNEGGGIGETSPDPLLLWMGSGHTAKLVSTAI